MELAKGILEYKEDAWKIPAETRVLEVNCKLNEHAARKIIERCRELEKIVFAGHAYSLTDKETILYLENLVFVEIISELGKYEVDENTAHKIKHLYETGAYTIQSLSAELQIPEKDIWHIVHEKAPVYRKNSKKLF